MRSPHIIPNRYWGVPGTSNAESVSNRVMKLSLVLICAGLAMWAAQPGSHRAFLDHPVNGAANVAQLNSLQGPEPSVAFSLVSGWNFVFVVELKMLRPAGGCRAELVPLCAYTARADVTRILKGADHRTPIAIDEFPIPALLPHLNTGQSWGWDSVMERQAGKKYLIASTQERDFRSMVVSPDFIFEIGDHEDLPGDVELILKCRALSIAEQVHAIAAAIMSGTESRSFFLAAYIDVLWKFESDIDIETLSQALKSAAGGALSDDAKYFVLSGLAPAHHMPNDAQKRLWSLFVTLTARYLVEEETKTGVAPGVRSVIADEFVPAILGTSSGQAELRAALEALMVFPKWRLTDAEKARARNWMAILQAR